MWKNKKKIQEEKKEEKPSSNKEGQSHKAIENIAKIAIDAINRMTPREIAYSNIKFNFGEYPALYKKGIECVNKILATHDPRDLTISFCNELTEFIPPNQKSIPFNHEVVKEAMDWLTSMAIKYTPFRVKWSCKIPRESLQTLDTFRAFTKKFDMTKKKTIEELATEGKLGFRSIP